ncbi:MAG: hypothetical protein HY958_10405 [Bacteroidia bacterium]|nr:hypothetical protein [Bacteroidia bacterium]
MKHFLPGIAFIFFISLIITSCEIINPAEEIPAYIRIEKIDLIDTTGAHGSLSSKITDAWINIDGNLLGVFELPKTFPALAKGKHHIMIRAGIKANGIAASRKWYPFYTSYILDTVLNESAITTLHPKVMYKNEANIELNETFEIGFNFDTIFPSEIALTRVTTPDKVFEGSYSGAIIMNGNKTVFKCKTSSSYGIPYSQTPIYLELNYKNNMEFVLGIFVNYATQSTLYQSFYHVNPSSEWNKVYIELTDMVQSNTGANSYNIYIGATKEDTTSAGEIYLDNIKLIHF